MTITPLSGRERWQNRGNVSKWNHRTRSILLDKIRKQPFIFGHTMADNDQHVLRLIEGGRMTSLWVGLCGYPNNQGNRSIISHAEGLAPARIQRKNANLEVNFYDAVSAEPWCAPSQIGQKRLPSSKNVRLPTTLAFFENETFDKASAL